jgi:hypothetical protein
MNRPGSTTTRRRRLAVVAVTTVALGGAVAVAPASAAPAPPTAPACVPMVCAANYLGLPVEHLAAELDEDVRASGGTPLEVLAARVDAVAAIRLGVVARTDGPMQVAAMRYLLDEHDRVRLAIVAAQATGNLPLALLPS